MYSFGSGVLYGVRTDSGVSNPTPVNFGLIQDVTIDQSATQKDLYGQYQYPVASARGSIKTTGKATVAKISGLAFANLFFGAVPVAGQLATQFQEAGAIPAASPYAVTVANAATFAGDFGVVYAATGLPFTKVASTPAQGQYTVAAGVYTFSAADTGIAVLTTYTYTLATGGQQFTVANQLLGTTPTFQAQFYTTFQGKTVSIKLNNCTSSKFSFATKLEDFVMPSFDFSCYADASNNIMTWSFSEVS